MHGLFYHVRVVFYLFLFYKDKRKATMYYGFAEPDMRFIIARYGRHAASEVKNMTSRVEDTFLDVEIWKEFLPFCRPIRDNSPLIKQRGFLWYQALVAQ